MKPNRLLILAIAAGSIASLVGASAQTVEKVADLSFYTSDGVGFGGYAPLDRFTQLGTNLWFTTSKGGTYDVGTVSRFDLVTREVVQVASFDNNTGKAAESPVLFIGDNGYFTTVNGGAGNKGTIASISLNDGTITTLLSYVTNGIPTGATPRGGLTQIGGELWTLTSSGGTSNRGVVLRYNLTNGVASLVTNLDGPILGGQPFDGLAAAGKAWYFTTFSGGNTFKTSSYYTFTNGDGSTAVYTNSLPLGAGTLGRLAFDDSGSPVVTKLVDLPGGYEQFPALAPILVGSNALYFASTGPNPLPGAILRYDLDTGFFTNLYSFPTNAASALQYGTRPGYSGLTEWLGELYFINRSGGTSNLGVVAKFNIASNTVVKLADLDGTAGQALGNATGFFGTGTIVEETNRFYIYYPLTSGGVNNRGTIIRVALPPPPIQAALAAHADTNQLTLTWTGGYPPFVVQSRADLTSGDWATVAENLTNRSATLPISGDQSFFRVGGAQ